MQKHGGAGDGVRGEEGGGMLVIMSVGDSPFTQLVRTPSSLEK